MGPRAIQMGVAGLALLWLGSCTTQSLPAQAAQLPSLRAGEAVAPALLGLALGPGQGLPDCGTASAASACVEDDADAEGIHNVRLAGAARLAGVHDRALALQLGDALESLSLQVDGSQTLQLLPGMLGQLCGAPSFDSRMQLDGGGQLWSMAWQCSDAQVQLNAVQHEAMAQGSLSLTTERGQQWFEGGELVAAAH